MWNSCIEEKTIFATVNHGQLAKLSNAGHAASRKRHSQRHVLAACRRHAIPLQVGGVGDALLGSLLPLGVCRLVLTGTDTDLMYTAAQGRVRDLDRWNRERQEVGTP